VLTRFIRALRLKAREFQAAYLRNSKSKTMLDVSNSCAQSRGEEMGVLPSPSQKTDTHYE
jgi:hypothetical protein